MSKEAFRRRRASGRSGGRLHAKAIQVGRPPRLGDVDGVERVEVQVDDPAGRIGDVWREPLEQAVGAVEPAGPDQPGDEAGVLDQEPVRVGDADACADRQESLRLRDARKAEVDRKA